MARLVCFNTLNPPPCASLRCHTKPCNGSVTIFRRILHRPVVTYATKTRDDIASLETSYLVAESATLLMGTLLTAFPGIFMIGLVPQDAPVFAPANGDLAVRLAASLLFMLSASMAALADASCKGNLTKSATYRRLNNACFLVCVTSLALALQAYAVSENMNSPVLLLALLVYLVPGSFAVLKGASAQGLLQPSQLQSKLQEDISALAQQLTRPASSKVGLFYQAEMIISLVAGAALLGLPASVMEFPEPNFGAETLMRRIVGGESALMAVICSLLLDASERGRLGASTFKALNFSAAVSVCLTSWWLANLVMVGTDGGTLSASAASANAMSASAEAVLLVFASPAAIFAYQGFAARK